MRIGVVAGGSFSFQRAFIDLKWKYFRIRGGVFMNDTIAESIVGPIDLYFVDYSIVENVYSLVTSGVNRDQHRPRRKHL
jgi:hypothetical protein